LPTKLLCAFFFVPMRSTYHTNPNTVYNHSENVAISIIPPKSSLHSMIIDEHRWDSVVN
jgi:hypothetical protein